MHGITHAESFHSSSFNIFIFGDDSDPQTLSVTINGANLRSYKLKEISKKVKFLNLMTFDLENPKIDTINVDLAVNFCIGEGVHLNRINIGIPTHGSCDVRTIEGRSAYAKFGGFNGIAIHSFDGDEYCEGFPLIRAAVEIMNRKRDGIN